MMARCHNPKHEHWSQYGGRGIKVCERWLKFENFLADMGDVPAGHVLDRINFRGNYEPSNCRWATHKLSTENRSNTVWINGLRVKDYAAAFGLTESAVYQRLRAGKIKVQAEMLGHVVHVVRSEREWVEVAK